MKLLFVAVFTPNSTNVSQSKGFKDNGCEVYEYDYRQRLSELGNNISHRDDDLIKTVNEWKPDLVVFSKCNQMHFRVVDELNKVSKTCMWYMDSTDNFNQELVEKIKRCTYTVVGIPGMVAHCKRFNKNSYFVDQCPDVDMNFMLEDFDYTHDVTFIGNIASSTHADRRKYIQAVGCEHINGKFGLEHNKIVNESKINLNFSHTDGNGASVRIYKILAAGGFLMTTPWVSEYMNTSFTPGEDFVLFNNEQELKEKIDYYLKNEDERNKIRLCGYNKVQQYLPKSWAKKIIDIYENKKTETQSV
jgi:spore maturation protein CgeB